LIRVVQEVTLNDELPALVNFLFHATETIPPEMSGMKTKRQAAKQFEITLHHGAKM
jgi:hypothetical protein